MKKKLFTIKRNGDAIASLLTQRAVLEKYNHLSIKAWMKYALIGQYHGILTPFSDGNTTNCYTVHRVQ